MKKWTIPIIFVLILFGLLVWNGYSKLEYDPNYEYIYLDAISLSGFFLLLFSSFIWLTQEGVFNILIYGTKRFFYYVFPFGNKSEKGKSYLEYSQDRSAKEKITLFPSLVIGGSLILIYLVLRLLQISI